MRCRVLALYLTLFTIAIAGAQWPPPPAVAVASAVRAVAVEPAGPPAPATWRRTWPMRFTEPEPVAPRPRQDRPTRHRSAVVASCGRSLARIAQDESGGSYEAQNPRSTASGKYQVLDSTWGNYGGYAKARLAPPEVQEKQAAELYAAHGSTPWRASGC